MSFMLVKNINDALRTMRGNRGRSFLTMLGVIIAVAAVTLIVSIGNGIQFAVEQQTNKYSKDVVTVRPARVGNAGGTLSSLVGSDASAALTNKDVSVISKVPHVTNSVPLRIVGTTADGDARYTGVVFAVNSELPEVVNQELAYGAFFSSKDSSNNVAVLGANAADKLFDQKVPLGRSFTIRGHQFIVNGVLSKFASTPFTSDANFNDAIFVPSGAVDDLAPNGSTIYEILAKVDSDSGLTQADTAISKAVAKAHGGQYDFNVLTPSELAKETADSFHLLTYLTLAASIITLLVSGVGIMNVMLVAVSERIHEIGIRKAVGATNKQVLDQFLTEAATLCVIGSVIGVIVALIISVFLHLFTSLTPQFDWPIAGISAVAACVFGVVFGTIPALKAARKDPIAALRNE
jgi:ABC-type antimicrobial peptide transport system permease subunit